jgi:hypothetical protein
MNRRRIATASIKKTHSQCQRWGLAPIAGEPAKLLSSSLENRGVVEPIGIEPMT